MTALHVAHLVALGLWGGVVLAEGVLEVHGQRGEAEGAFAARVHHWIDLVCEIPLLLAVLATGAILAWRAPMTTTHLVKIACGLFAVGVNVWCVGVVVRRRRAADAGDAAEVTRGTRLVFLAIKLGVPAAAVALYLGFTLVPV